MNRNCCTNSVPYGYGGRRADTMVFPVRIIMSPTCSSRFLVGKKTRSAAARTTPVTPPLRKPMPCLGTAPEGTVTGATPMVSGYVPRAVRAWRIYGRGQAAGGARCAAMVSGLCVLALALAGCGGGERQDKNEAAGN